MKKYRIKNAKRFTSFVTLVILTFVFVAGSAMGLFNASSKDITTYTTVQVQAGDTLWNLARTYGAANKDVRETVYEICRLNDISADTLMPGQFITIPN